MPYRFVSLAALALSGMAAAQQHSTPSEAAKTFTLDGIAPAPAATPAADPAISPTSTPTVASPAVPASDSVTAPLPATAAPPASASPPPDPASAVPPPALRAVFTLDTPIKDLIANPAAKAVLDKDLPGMSDDSNLDKFRELSLRGFQPLTGGQLTDAMLTKVAGDLNAIVGGEAQVVLPKTPGTSKRDKDDSR